ncbi:uncharacterized protein VTP21DRAFT_11007 [Calcarisporiella thermophila]|uniref:uncharacterized protein n=1 Tax=Calcarisporiella thermophila TaxID=911321 RepID=UPI003744AB06
MVAGSTRYPTRSVHELGFACSFLLVFFQKCGDRKLAEWKVASCTNPKLPGLSYQDELDAYSGPACRSVPHSAEMDDNYVRYGQGRRCLRQAAWTRGKQPGMLLRTYDVDLWGTHPRSAEYIGRISPSSAPDGKINICG